MTIARRSTKPAGITNQSGEPELELEINGLKLSMTPPPAKAEPPGARHRGEASASDEPQSSEENRRADARDQ